MLETDWYGETIIEELGAQLSRMTPEEVAFEVEQLGIDVGAIQASGTYLRGLMSGDLGISQVTEMLKSDIEVKKEIADGQRTLN